MTSHLSFLPISLVTILLIGIGTIAAPGEEVVLKKLSDRDQRGKLVDRFEQVRGDSGKWRDKASLQISPPPPKGANNKPVSLDGWADALHRKRFSLSPETPTWLIYRTAQLDDKDRLWIESVTRRENRIVVIMNRATWQGYYSKNFTWYGNLALNLGKLPEGKYTVEWIVNPFVFEQFEDPKNHRSSWPKDEQIDPENKSESLSVKFAVTGSGASLGGDAAAESIAKALPYLEKEGAWWIEKKKCVSCHHTSFLLWAKELAFAGGFSVDPAILDKQREWAWTAIATSRESVNFSSRPVRTRLPKRFSKP